MWWPFWLSARTQYIDFNQSDPQPQTCCRHIARRLCPECQSSLVGGPGNPPIHLVRDRPWVAIARTSMAGSGSALDQVDVVVAFIGEEAARSSPACAHKEIS